MRNILIIGGSGFLGYYLIRKLKNNNNLYCHKNKTTFKYNSLTIVKVNLTNKVILKKFLKKKKIDLIINLASIAWW